MNKRITRILIVTCISAAVAGCAMPRSGEPRGGGMENHGKPRQNDQVCNAAVCKIDVRIECDASGCAAVVDPKVLLILSSSGPKIIQWKLTGQDHDYEFKDVEVIPGKPAFQCQRPGQHQKQAMCKDIFGGGEPSTEYSVHVIKSSDGSELAVDPWIVNR